MAGLVGRAGYGPSRDHSRLWWSSGISDVQVGAAEHLRTDLQSRNQMPSRADLSETEGGTSDTQMAISVSILR